MLRNDYQGEDKMKNNIKDKLQKLLEEGKKFTYINSFQSWSEYGHPNSFKMEYISWKTKAKTFLQSNFGKASPVMKVYSDGERINVLGNDSDNFNRAHGNLLGAVSSAIDLLEFIPSNSKDKKNFEGISKKIFIVHGHDEILKNQVESFLNDIGLEPIVLHRKPDEGLTLIEKFEKHSDVGYAIILLTPDDIGYPSTESSKKESERNIELRARQNVIFEFGYFAGKLGRNRVCCLYKEGVMLPTDLGGIIYKEVHKDVTQIGISIMKDLKAVGYQVKI